MNAAWLTTLTLAGENMNLTPTLVELAVLLRVESVRAGEGAASAAQAVPSNACKRASSSSTRFKLFLKFNKPLVGRAEIHFGTAKVSFGYFKTLLGTNQLLDKILLTRVIGHKLLQRTTRPFSVTLSLTWPLTRRTNFLSDISFASSSSSSVTSFLATAAASSASATASLASATSFSYRCDILLDGRLLFLRLDVLPLPVHQSSCAGATGDGGHAEFLDGLFERAVFIDSVEAAAPRLLAAPPWRSQLSLPAARLAAAHLAAVARAHAAPPPPRRKSAIAAT
eukprot:CAMPEP_0202076420 /NCGR_PEP_ID=MMETSP0964-20121228/4801_1 /ASSEMBLY_ACC=CAM_ASM_000500 /TAXON_ID=4773 /ORGANISM="Schizochytrium aggregatum, Strain ATCC28209" /LENGTH=281 /DNA_ID=CAMNT_0048643665 /DNA_START=139 /DNA_END=980 /DNA_ORIENTATION=+